MHVDVPKLAAKTLRDANKQIYMGPKRPRGRPRKPPKIKIPKKRGRPRKSLDQLSGSYKNKARKEREAEKLDEGEKEIKTENDIKTENYEEMPEWTTIAL